MKKHIFLLTMVFGLMVTACAQPTPEPTATPLPTDTPIPPTATPVPPTPTFTPTPIPGKVVIPIERMGSEIPWLGTADAPNRPGTMYYGFNVNKAPFNIPEVRQAFAAAIDRQVIADMATKYYWQNVLPATTFVPPEMLGRYLYEEVGIPFDPDRARELLKEAGYEDTSAFPTVNLWISASSAEAPGAYQLMAQEIAAMWEEHLGVEVKIRSVGYVGDLVAELRNNIDECDVYRLFLADSDLDPGYLGLMHSDEEYNYDFNFGNYSNPEFDRLVEQLSDSSDPEERQLLAIEAEKILTEVDAAIIPLYHSVR
jgi:ABC-type transport system substrate-binding protein